jgi:hypothetical protein
MAAILPLFVVLFIKKFSEGMNHAQSARVCACTKPTTVTFPQYRIKQKNQIL